MNDLTELLKISAFGRKVFIGSFYDIKFRYKITPIIEELITKLKSKYNHMYVYRTKDTGIILFGGRFHVNDTFAEEVTTAVKAKEKVF